MGSDVDGQVNLSSDACKEMTPPMRSTCRQEVDERTSLKQTVVVVRMLLI
jgi:hypothetical protein